MENKESKQLQIGVLLSGCGVYDGAEIQEAVLTLLAIDEIGAKAICIAANKNQFHVINHVTGEVMPETRNMFVEAARIARGDIHEIDTIAFAELDAIVLPGGFGSAKNFTKWAFDGPNGEIDAKIKLLLVNLYNIGRPIVALCVSPTVVAKALEGIPTHPTMTIGSNLADSPYSISEFAEGLTQTGVKTTMRTKSEIEIDTHHKIITAPCYMMQASIGEVNQNIRTAMAALVKMIASN
jgi:enhancing lycopene biosynthesis protein 2